MDLYLELTKGDREGKMTQDTNLLKNLLFELDISAGIVDSYRSKEMEFRKKLGDLPDVQQKQFFVEYDRAYGTHYFEAFITEKTDSPVDLTDRNLIPVSAFPFEVLPQELFDFVNAASEALQVEPHIAASIAITIVSAAIGNTIRISPKEGFQVSPFLWTAIIAPTGYGKSPLFDALLSPLTRLQGRAYKDYRKDREEYEQEIRKTKNGKDAKIPDEPKLKHYFVSDHTVESLINVFASDGRGVLLHHDELSGLIFSFDQYKHGGGNDRQHYLTLFNCGS